MAKDVFVDIYPSEVLYDVKNKAFLTGRSRYNGQNDEEKANIQASDDEQDDNQIRRSITSAMHDLLPKLAEYNPEYGEKIMTGTLLTERGFRPYANVPNDGSGVQLGANDEGTPGKHFFNNVIFSDPEGNKPVVLHLNVPSNFNESVTPTIAHEVHQYLVNVAMSDWFLITDKTDAADYATLAQSCIVLIREALNKRVRPQRTHTFS